MKIFQVVPYYPPHIGGMEFYVQRLSEELAERGHEVTVFTSASNKKQSVSRVKGVTVYSLKTMTKAYNVPIVPSLFWRLLQEKKPDIIHTHQYPVFFSDVSAVVSRLRGIPLLIHVHVVSDSKSPLSGFISDMYYSSLGLKTLKAAKTVIVPSLAYKTKLQEMHLPSKKIKVISYGIETKKFHGSKGTNFKTQYNLQDSKIILTVGRLNYQKGLHYLIQAMPNILKQVPDAKLVIVGEGEQSQYLKQLTASLSLDKVVVFAGPISPADIGELYAAADLFVLPSLFESFGIVLIEAQAAGKPVIGTRTGGVPEALVEGKTGFLVDPGNVQSLETATIKVLTDNALAESMGRNGARFAQKFDIQSVVSNIITAYNNCIPS